MTNEGSVAKVMYDSSPTVLESKSAGERVSVFCPHVPV